MTITSNHGSARLRKTKEVNHHSENHGSFFCQLNFKKKKSPKTEREAHRMVFSSNLLSQVHRQQNRRGRENKNQGKENCLQGVEHEEREGISELRSQPWHTEALQVFFTATRRVGFGNVLQTELCDR